MPAAHSFLPRRPDRRKAHFSCQRHRLDVDRVGASRPGVLKGPGQVVPIAQRTADIGRERKARGEAEAIIKGRSRARRASATATPCPPPAAWRVIEPGSTLCRCGCGEWRYLRARHSARISSAVLQHLRSDAPMQQSLFPFCAGVRAAFERLLYGARDRAAYESGGISSKRFGPVLAGI